MQLKRQRAPSRGSNFSKAICIVLLCAVNITVGCKRSLPAAHDTSSGPEKRIAYASLPPCEQLIYKIKWLGLPVGTVTASIKGVVSVGQRHAYEIELRAKTNAFCSAIYRIDDRYVSYIDTEHFYTLRHEVYRREGHYRKDAITEFDQENHRAYYRNLLDGTNKEYEIPPAVQDTLSACYYFMVLPTDVGDEIEYAVSNNEKNYRLSARIEKKSKIKVPARGKIDAVYVQPYVTLNGEEVRKGRVSGYFSCDERRIPLIAIVRAPLFTQVTVYLYSIKREES